MKPTQNDRFTCFIGQWRILLLHWQIINNIQVLNPTLLRRAYIQKDNRHLYSYTCICPLPFTPITYTFIHANRYTSRNIHMWPWTETLSFYYNHKAIIIRAKIADECLSYHFSCVCERVFYRKLLHTGRCNKSLRKRLDIGQIALLFFLSVTESILRPKGSIAPSQKL